MLCIDLKGYKRLCGAVTGGLSGIYIGDPMDFNFTADEETGAYSSIEVREGGGKLFPIDFVAETGDLTATQSVNGCSTKYEYTLVGQLADNSQELKNFFKQLDRAGCCCGILIVVVTNSGKVFILGERYVNEEMLPKRFFKNDGTSLSFGKLLDDFNGADLSIKGSLPEMANEFTGGLQAIADLEEGAKPTPPPTDPSLAKSNKDAVKA